MEKHYSIAIDGPSGAGKSTFAKMTAADLGFVYVDTGAIYRSVGLYALQKGVDSKDARAVEALLKDIEIELGYADDGSQQVFLNGRDVSGEIRSPEVSIYASDVSAMPPVRAFLLEMQRDMARKHNVIMDGRDIGTVVLPDADLKIFLTASVEARAKRRYIELREKGTDCSFEEVLRDMEYRDKNDSTRQAAPLRAAEDSVTVDTSELDLQESFELIRKTIRDRLGI